MKRLRYDVQHSEKRDGISYRVVGTDEDIQRCLDFCFKYFLEGMANFIRVGTCVKTKIFRTADIEAVRYNIGTCN